MTARIGEYIDSFLQPLVLNTLTYLWDTKHVLKQLRNLEFKEGMVLGTADISSLYNNIAHVAVMWAVIYYLQQDHEIPVLQREFILDLL